MGNKYKYATITVARNEQDNIVNSVQSILDQSIPPTHLVVVDDGSTDNTTKILKSLEERYKYPFNILPSIPEKWLDINFKLVIRRNRGFSALSSYLIADVYNTGMKYLFTKDDWDYLFVISSDTYISTDYAKKMIDNMGDDYGAASGECGHTQLSPDACYGAGRVIRRDVLESLAGFPRTYAWEEGCLIYSWMIGLKTGHFDNARFSSRLPDVKKERAYILWGRGMKDGGITYVHLFYSVAKKIIINRQLMVGIKFIVGYFAQPYPENCDWVDYRIMSEKIKIKKAIKRKILKILP